MRKTSLYIADSLDDALGRVAAREGLPKAEVIRRALAAAAEGAPRPRLAGIGAIDMDPIPPDELDDELRRSGFGR